MSTHFSGSSDHWMSGSAGRGDRTGREVVCKICEAVYVPSQTHKRLARSPQAVVESAFLSMCHFCFRCRRPACPSCWDDVHEVCGACTLEAQLPFRSNAPPLDGTVSPLADRSQGARVRILTSPLICVRPGRFQSAPLPIESQTTLFLPTLPDRPLYDPRKRQPARNIPTSSSAKPQPRADVADIVTRPGRRRAQNAEQGHKTAMRPDKPEHIVWEVVLLVVLLIIAVMVSALLFPNVNNGIAQFLHVDIRAKITYLLQLIQHLF